jgi:hypothetical protein
MVKVMLGGIMARNRRRNAIVAGLLGAAVAWIVLAAHPAEAACTADPCAGGGVAFFDCDRDGLTDEEECSLGLQVALGAGIDFLSCRDPNAVEPDCLDPVVADQFVLFQKASPSVYDELGISNEEAFGPITQTDGGGLALRIHVLDASTTTLPSSPQPNAITPRQAALHVVETRTPSSPFCPVTANLGAINGVTSTNNAAVAQVFSQRIVDLVDCVYDSVDPAIPQDDRQAHKVEMVTHTTAHESLHPARGAPERVERFGGHHYRTKTGCVLDQSTTYSTKRGVVNFAVPLDFCGPTQAAVVAGETDFGQIQCEDLDNILDEDGFVQGCLPAGP